MNCSFTSYRQRLIEEHWQQQDLQLGVRERRDLWQDFFQILQPGGSHADARGR